jgi:hypothetical protein
MRLPDSQTPQLSGLPRACPNDVGSIHSAQAHGGRLAMDALPVSLGEAPGAFTRTDKAISSSHRCQAFLAAERELSLAFRGKPPCVFAYEQRAICRRRPVQTALVGRETDAFPIPQER